jgi:outer membrane lipoprotein-sorting protein
MARIASSTRYFSTAATLAPARAARPAHPSRLVKAIAFCLVTIVGLPAAAETDPQFVVEQADRVRFPDTAFQVDVRITTEAPGRDPDTRSYRVLAKGNRNSLVLTTAPASERGQILLMKGDDLWVFMPSVSQPVRLPFSQRLTGQVANGDLARANLAGDYTPTIVASEVIKGEPHHVLDLKANRKGVTYQRVRYWVRERDYRPHKAEFYTLSGRLMKTCFYEDYRPMEGSVRPARLIMVDALRKGERSVLEYAELRRRELADNVFTKEYLKKLQ